MAAPRSGCRGIGGGGFPIARRLAQIALTWLPIIKKEFPIKSVSSNGVALRSGSYADGVFRWKVMAGCLLLVISCLWSFFPSLSCGFVDWDDPKYLFDNYNIQELSPSSIYAIFTSFFNSNYHPLTTLSFAIDVRCFGWEPFFFHFQSMIWHVGGVLGVFFLVWLLEKNLPMAFFTALLWGIHPLRVESVTWISERKDVMFGFFYIFSMIAYAGYQNHGSFIRLAGSFLLFSMALCSKSQAVTLPIILIGMDWLKQRLNQKAVLEKIPFFLLSLVFGILALKSQNVHAGMGIYTSDLKYHAFIGFHSFQFYCWKTVFPFDLSPVYLHPLDGWSGLSWPFFTGPFFLLFLGYVTLRFSRGSRLYGFGMLLFLTNILPVAQFISIGRCFAADRYTYIPGVGLTIFFSKWWVEIVSSWAKRFPSINVNIGWTIPLVIAAFFFQATHARCWIWKDSISLWSDAILSNPAHPMPLSNRAFAFFKEGNDEEALVDAGNALRLDPDCGPSFNLRGIVKLRQGNPKEDLGIFLKAIKKNSTESAYYLNAGIAENALKNPQSAAIFFEKALSMDPRSKGALNTRAIFLMERGDLEGSLRDVTLAIQLFPKIPILYKTRAKIYEKMGRTREAAADL